MEKSEVKKRIQKLRSEIARLRNAYHVNNAPNVTDDVYDSLTRELKSLLAEFPEFEDMNASENRVAGKPLDKFEKVKHQTRMLSLNDAFSEQELLDWEKRIKKLLPPSRPGEGRGGEVINYFCEVKFDGLAGSLIYENGKFVRGATRGGGFGAAKKYLILKTLFILLLHTSPLPEVVGGGGGGVLEIRGEVVMSKKTL